MDTTTFDGIARNLGSSLTRRSALRGFFAGAAALVAGGAVLPETEAKRRRKKGKGKNKKQNQNQNQNGTQQQFLPPGAFCQSNAQCDASKGYICEVAVNASNSDKTCSGATGAICGAPNGDGDDTAPFCAAGYRCVGGICQSILVDLVDLLD